MSECWTGAGRWAGECVGKCRGWWRFVRCRFGGGVGRLGVCDRCLGLTNGNKSVFLRGMIVCDGARRGVCRVLLIAAILLFSSS